MMTVFLSASTGLAAAENPRHRRGGRDGDNFIERLVKKVLRWAGPVFNDGVLDNPGGKG